MSQLLEKTIDSAITGDPVLAAPVEEATRILVDELGPSAGRARVDWRLSSDDRGRELVDLTVSDWTGAVTYRFAREELGNRPHMELRLHRLWGDLLMVRSHHQLDSVIWGLNAGAGA